MPVKDPARLCRHMIGRPRQSGTLGEPACTRKSESHNLKARFCLTLSTIALAAMLLAPTSPADPLPTLPAADVAIARAESLLGSDQFGAYGCEALVAFAYDVPQEKYGWDGASESMYQTLLGQDQIHTDMNPPRGALVFSKGSDGPHIDIARGDGTYISGGVQGLARGYGDRHNIQILPTPNVGRKWQYRGWSSSFPQ
jgi:hypothetical protein